MSHPCPCCGFLTIDDPPGSYEICVICGWEEDPVQSANPCTGGGANSESLAQAQDNFQSTPEADLSEYGANGYTRDAAWRLLNMTERAIFKAESENGARFPNRRIETVAEYYWNRNIVQEKT